MKSRQCLDYLMGEVSLRLNKSQFTEEKYIITNKRDNNLDKVKVTWVNGNRSTVKQNIKE